MTLAKMLRQKVAKWKPASSGRHVLNVAEEGGWAAILTADRCDELGCLVWDLTLRRQGEPLAADALRAWADRAAGRVTGLLEPLKVIEVDTPRGAAQLRSAQPSDLEEGKFYYEVVLKSGHEASVCRYQAAGAGRRQQVAFALTHEALGKLADDLTA